MKIKRLDLIKMTQQRLDVIAQKREDDVKRLNEQNERNKREYVSATADAWNQFAATIVNRIHDGDVVTRDDIPREITSGYGDTLRLFSGVSRKIPAHTETESQLRALIDTLNSTVDDEVSTYALEKMGFRLGIVYR